MTGDTYAHAQLRALAAAAGLTIPAEREAQVDSVLQAWLVDANALSCKMGEAQFQALVPATVFSHPPTDDEEN
jgi:hypothetical protein